MRIYKTKFIIISIIGMLLISTGLVLYSSETIEAESQTKGQIAYVDLWAVFNVHPEKSIAESELNQLAQSMQIELEEKAKDLSKDQQQDLLKEYQSELSQHEQDLIQNIIESIKEVVVKVAIEKEVKMVLDQKNVIYGGYDMTGDVIDFIGKNKIEASNIQENTLEDSAEPGTDSLEDNEELELSDQNTPTEKE